MFWVLKRTNPAPKISVNKLGPYKLGPKPKYYINQGIIGQKQFFPLVTETLTALHYKMIPPYNLEKAATGQYKLSCVSFENCE